MTLTVIDAGPIPFAALQRYDDPELETLLERDGLEPAATMFRLVEVSLTDLEDVRWLPGPLGWGTHMIDALQAGDVLPPIVIAASPRGANLFALLDGLNRTYAHWKLGRQSIRAYELLSSSSAPKNR